MRHAHFLSTLLALLILLPVAAVAQAADDVASQIPATALGYGVVNNIQQASSQLDQTAQRMQLPAPGLLSMAKQVLQLNAVVETGDMAVALIASESGRPFPVIFVRTSNYQQLLAQLNPAEQDGPVSRVNVAGEATLIANKGNYALFGPPDHRDGMKRVVESRESVQVDEALTAFCQPAAAYVVVTNRGVKLLSQQAIGGLQMVKQQIEQSGQPQVEMVTAGLGVYEELFKWASQEVGQFALALRPHDSGAVSLATRVDLLNPEQLPAHGATTTAAKRLEHLPNWPYVVAMAGEFGESKYMEKWMQLSMDMMRGVAGKQLTDQQLKQLMESSRKSMEGLRGMSFTFGVPQVGDTLFSRMGMVMDVENSQAYIDQYVASMQQTSQILSGSGAPYRILTAEKTQVAGAQGMKVVMQMMPAIFGAGGPPQLQEMFKKLYGAEGKVEIYAAPAGRQRVALAYSSEASLKELIQTAQAGSGLGADAAAQATARLLPQQAQWAGYISPQGVVGYAKWAMQSLIPQPQQAAIPQIPDFPSSPPLGFSLHYNGAAIEAGLVAPADSLTAAGVYIQAIQQLAAPR